MISSNNSESIRSIINLHTHQNEELIKTINQIMYWFRGALNRNDAWAMSHPERELAIEFINERFEDAKEYIKNKIPVFF